MRLALLVCLCAPADAGILHGIVLEQATSRPLARTEVRLLRVGSTTGVTPSARAKTTSPANSGFPHLPTASISTFPQET